MRLRLLTLLSSVLLAGTLLLPTVAPAAAPDWIPASRLRFGPPLAGGLYVVLDVDLDEGVATEVRRDVAALSNLGPELQEHGILEVRWGGTDEIVLVSEAPSEQLGAVLAENVEDYVHVCSAGQEHRFKLVQRSRAQLEAGLMSLGQASLEARVQEDCPQATVEPLVGGRLAVWRPAECWPLR